MSQPLPPAAKPEGRLPAWLFPVPVRPSRFAADRPEFAQFNVEVARDRLPAFAFAPAAEAEVLYYDLQTQLTGNSWGRLGSGRSGIYRGHYLKGVGRTPAAANWNEASDLYHGSGHLSVGSAIRERTITAFLEARGLGTTIVPCRTVLVGRLTPAERRAVRQGESSSRAHFTAADAELLALTVKPADFARMSNVVFALNHFEDSPARLGELFLDFEHFLHPPSERTDLEGSPAAIALALDRAFRRGLANFRAHAQAGLFWLYLDSNFTLDGRFLDLETPIYFGAPFVGTVTKGIGPEARTELLGFEEFGLVRHWRAFLRWLRERLRFLAQPGMVSRREARTFLRELARELARAFPAGHLLFDDAALVTGAIANLARPLGLGRCDRGRLRALAELGFPEWVSGHSAHLPATGWQPVSEPPAPATSQPRRFECTDFSTPGVTAEGKAFADALATLGAERDPRELLRLLAHPTKVG